MAITIIQELVKSRDLVEDLKSKTTTYDYILLRDIDQDVARAALLAYPDVVTPPTGLLLLDIKLSHQGGGVWFATVTFANNILGPELSFDTTGGNQHITQSKETTYSVKAGAQPPARTFFDAISVVGSNVLTSAAGAAFVGGDVGKLLTGNGIPIGTTIVTVSGPTSVTMSNPAEFAVDGSVVSISSPALVPPDYQRAIGVSKDGVKGCDILNAKLEFTLNVSYPAVTLTDYLTYMALFNSLTDTVNAAPFYTFARGEVLFLGGQGNSQVNGTMRAAMKFACSPNRTNIDLIPPDPVTKNPVLRIPQKEGWEYLWVTYETKFGTGGLRIARPTAAYLERVYEYGDFTLLGL